MATGNHPDIVGPYVHVIHNWTYATAAARTADTAFMSWDVYKIALQSDDNSLWMLLDDSPPTWLQLTGAGIGYTDEQVRDIIGATLYSADPNIVVSVNDPLDSIALLLSAGIKTSTLNFVIDGGGSVITTGIKGDLVVDFNCTIQSVTALADQVGSIVVDIWKDTYANYPPVVGDTITASAPVTITSANKSQNTTLTGWTTTVTAGDTVRFNVNSCSAITRATIALKVLRS